MQRELLLRQGGAQVGLERHMLVHGLLHARVEKAQRAAPGHLGLVHGQVGLLEQLSHGGGLIIEQGHAYAGRAAVLVARQGIGKGERVQYLLAHLVRMFG